MKVKKNEWLTYYEVKLFDPQTHTYEELGGFITAEDYSDAAAQLEDIFADELTSINLLKMYDDDFLMMPVTKSRDAKSAYEKLCGG